MSPVDITVVICTYNRAQQLRYALSDVARQIANSFSFEVVVVDDQSTDDTQEVVADFARTSAVAIRLVEAKGTTVAAARNRGLKAARGTWVAYFDDDQRAPKGWLHELWRTASSSKAEFVGGPISLDLPPGAQAGPTVRAILGEYPPARSDKSATPLPPGGNRLISMDVFARIGPHDESIFTGGEDYDILMRAQRAGVRFAWAPRAEITHVIPPDRLRPEAMRAYCQMAGASRARSDAQRSKKIGLAGTCLRRLWRGWILNAICSLMFRPGRPGLADCQARFNLTTGYLRTGIKEITGSTTALEGESPSATFRDLRHFGNS